MKAHELRVQGTPELQRRLDDGHRELFNLSFQRATRQLVKTSEIRRVRKDIARINTVLRERELGDAG